MNKTLSQNRSQYSLSSAFLAMTAVSVVTALIMLSARTTLSDSSHAVIWVCLLFIPGVIMLFAISTAILISIIALFHVVVRTASRIAGSAIRRDTLGPVEELADATADL